MTNRRKRGSWSHVAGQKGRNWVRAFQHWRSGAYYLEWFEPRTDPDTGEDVQRRKRMKLADEDQTESRAVVKAEELAESFAELVAETAEPPVTLRGLLTDYLREVTPNKSKGKRGHDRRARRLWVAFLDSRPEARRRSDRHPSTLDRKDWESFIVARRDGEIPGWEREVGERQVQYDIKFMIAVLNWGAGTVPMGGSEPYVPQGSPWRPEIRRAQHWPMPKPRAPHRPAMTEEIRAALVEHAPSWQFGLALILQRDTRSRNSHVRRLDWSDIDQEAWTIRWRGELDKTGREATTPLVSEEAINALKKAPSRGIAGPVFPSATDPSVPTPRNTWSVWLRRAKRRHLRALEEAGASDEQLRAWKEKLRGLGYHAEKRAGVREAWFRELPPKMQESLARTSFQTLRTVYDDVTPEELRRAAQEARRMTGTGDN